MSCKRITLVALAVPALFLVAGCSDSTGVEDGSRTERFTWSGQIAAAAAVEIRNINGEVRARPGPDGLVHVTAIKTGRDDHPSTVRIEVVESALGVTICAVYPDVPGLPANECRPGLAGQLASRDNDVSVDFDVEVPAGRAFHGATIGSVEAIGMTGFVDARAIGGDVTIATTALASAATVNGDIDASIGRVVWDRDLSFTAVSGDVTVRLPAQANANVRGSTAWGSISTDFPLGITRVGTSRQMQGRIGSGGRILAITTTHGDIALRAR